MMRAKQMPEDLPTIDVSKGTTPLEEIDDHNHLTGMPLALSFTALCISTFLCALDATIIATAIPTITAHFDSLSDVAWYNSAYLLALCAFQLPFGRAYTIFQAKWTYMTAIVIFEAGSVICGTAPTSTALIVGRAIQGTGSAGILGGSLIVIAEITPLERRELFTGLLTAMFAIASAVGPLLGGAFTDSISWRWCFYINLLVGAVAFVVVFFFLSAPGKSTSQARQDKSWLHTILRFDPLGTLIFIPSIISLLLALEWGNSTYAWSNGRIIALLVCFGVSIVTWIAVQIWEGDSATVPLSVASQRTVACATIYMFLGGAAFTLMTYYLPIWFQSIKHNTALQSGIHTIPLTLSVVTMAIVSGIAVSKLGYYVPFMYTGTICLSIGAGLLMLLKPNSNEPDWIGHQILFGFGVGLSMNVCTVAVQAVLPKEKVSSGTSIVIFARALGGSLSLSIGQNVLDQNLQASLRKALPQLNPNIVSKSGATDLVSNVKKAVGGDQVIVQEVLELYNHAVTRTFLVALVLACLTVIPLVEMEWKSVKKAKKVASTQAPNKEGVSTV